MVIDKRRDPNAHTGMFELAYRQNMPRVPAYLGMSLSVRGRKLFKLKKTRSKEKGEEKSIKKKRNEAIGIVKNSNILPKYVDTIRAPTSYKGPIINDLIEELHAYYDNNDNYCGVDFVPPIQPPSRKKHSDGKHERVSKRKICKGRVINGVSVNRELGVNENRPMPRKCSSVTVNKQYLHVFNQWLAKNREVSSVVDEGNWEQNTASILEGKNILSKLNIEKNNKSNSITNKNYVI